MARAMLRGAAFVGLCGAVGYFATDALESALLFRTGSRLLLEHAEKDADLQEQLGPPLHIGRWYNAAIGVRPGGLAADCALQLSGTQRDANATIQMNRRPSRYNSILLYQLLGPGEWDVVAVNAMVAKGSAQRIIEMNQAHAIRIASRRPFGDPITIEVRRLRPSTADLSLCSTVLRLKRRPVAMDNPAQLLTQVGIMNKISQTGNTVVDLLLCIVLPLLLTQIAPHFDRMRQWWQAFLMRGSKKWQREISFVRRDGWYYRDDDEAPNNLLQQAIIMYMSTNEDLCSQYVNAQLALGKKPVQREDDVAGKHGKDGSESDSDDYAYDTARQLKQYQVNTVPPLDHWVDLGDLAEGVEFMRTESVMERGDGKRSDTTVTFHLQSARKNGPELIDAFVDAAYHYYRAALEEKSEKLRYLYSPTHAEGNDDSQKGVVYKRYQLSDEKTFASLFHPQKASLLRLVDHFLHKTGKFAIPGYQHKLGLLLHGPPGTGKTSLVKALAHYTDRNIISVPLSQISTNQQLQDIVFDQVFKVVGDDLPYNLPFSKTIFLLEDVDAACDVVKRRSPGPASPAQIAALSAAAAANAKRKASPASRQRRSERSSDCSDSSGDENSGCEQRHRQRSPAGSGEGDVDGGLDGPLVPFGPEKKGAAGLMAGLEHPDKLNLAGLLNVLDGVVCCPNRIVVMTTNHLSKLDPALIRPGRVSKQIFMGNLVLESALQMVEHYFCCLSGGKLTAGEVAAFTAVFEDGELSPAELEMRCCDVDTVDELVAALRDRHVV